MTEMDALIAEEMRQRQFMNSENNQQWQLGAASAGQALGMATATEAAIGMSNDWMGLAASDVLRITTRSKPNGGNKQALPVKLSEKEQLAQDLGMHTWVAQERNKRLMTEEIKRLTDMKFKVTTFEEASAKIMRPIKARFYKKFIPACAALLVAVLASLILGKPYVFCAPLIAIPGIAVMGEWLSRHSQIRVDAKALYQWTEAIPYGGLLAVKEAEGKGMREFQVAFPTRARVLLKDDPIIMGRKDPQSPWVEVFAWDAGKVYE